MMVGLRKREGNEGAWGVSGYLTSWWLICTIKPKGVWPEARNKVATEKSTCPQDSDPRPNSPFLPVASLKDLLNQRGP